MSTCVICNNVYEGYGNVAQPLADGYCCDGCAGKVIQERLRLSFAEVRANKAKKAEDDEETARLDASGKSSS